MKTVLRRFSKEYGSIIFLLLFYTVFHIALSPGYWDDEYFRNAMGGSINNLFPFLLQRYIIWSPRVVIEFVIGLLSVCPYAVWKAFDLLIILLLYKDMEWFLKHIFNISDPKANWGLAFLLCSLPFSIMACTGWLATTTNYLWVIGFGWYAVNKVIKNVILEKELAVNEKILTVLSVLYSGNFESVAAMMLMGMLVVIIYEKYFKHKKISFFLWSIMLISVFLLTGIIACPGNKIRLAKDIEVWMPDYEKLHLIDKLRMGIVTAFMHFVSIPSPIFFMLNSICLIAAFMKKGSGLQKMAAAFPVTADIVWTGYYMLNYLLGKKTMTYQIPNSLLADKADMVEQLIMIITIMLWFVSLFYSLYWIQESKKFFFLCATVLMVACVPEIVVGMSPTVVNSMLRTVIYLYLGMMVLILCFWKELQVYWKRFTWFRMTVCFVLACGIALNALQMTRHVLVYG